MKKQVLCLSVVVAAVMGVRGAENKNTHLVQEGISALENQLKTAAPYSQERRKLIGYLRGYFNNKMHNSNKKLKRLTNPNTRNLADSITGTYDAMAKDHKQAAEHYAQRATGVVALNVRPHGGSKMKSMSKIQPTAAEPVAQSKKSGGWLQEMESMVGLGQDDEPSQRPVRSTVSKVGGVAAAGTAGAAAGTVAAVRAQQAKVSTKKSTDLKKKQQKIEKKKKKAGEKKGSPKKRKKSMSEKKKAKKAVEK